MKVANEAILTFKQKGQRSCNVTRLLLQNGFEVEKTDPFINDIKVFRRSGTPGRRHAR